MSTDDPRNERSGVPPEDTPPGGNLPPPPGQAGASGVGSQPGPQPPGPQHPGHPEGQWQPAWQQVGVVPPSVDGPYYSIGLVILLTIVTCGIWGAFWTYRTSEDLKNYTATVSVACSEWSSTCCSRWC